MQDNPNGNTVNDRLDRSVNGAPRLNPDEQRKYLGTFRERVSLGIKIQDLDKALAFNDFKKELQAHPQYLLIINGNLPDDLTTNYITYASQHNVQFTIKTDSFYRTSPDNYGLIFASHHTAIDQYPINVFQKYPDHSQSDSSKTTRATQKPSKPTLWDRIKKLF